MAKGKYSRSEKISNTILVDKDSKVNILGIEVMGATTNIPSFNPDKVNFQVQSV